MTGITRDQIDAYSAYMTPRERELMEAWQEHGTIPKAAEAIGIHTRNVERAWKRVRDRAAKQGFAPDYDYTRPVPDGFLAKGVSTYYNKDGKPAGQWVKSAIDHDRQREIMLAAFEGMKDEIPRFEPLPVTAHFQNQYRDMCVAYPVGDHHLGMLAWDKETGADWDLKLAEAALNKATDYLVTAAPSASQGLVVFLGDFLHYDGFVPETQRSKNVLDSDSRFPKMVRTGIRTMRYLVDAALQKHEKVHLIIEIGNHDDASAIWLMELMAVAYENEPRLTVDTSPMRVHYYRFGKNFICVTHGDQIKMQNIPLLMATDRKEDWAASEHRFGWTGHVHKSQTQVAMSAQDYSGVQVESFRILAAADAWAAGMGYRAIRDMKSIVLHAEHGEVSRNTVNPGMFK